MAPETANYAAACRAVSDGRHWLTRPLVPPSAPSSLSTTATVIIIRTHGLRARAGQRVRHVENFTEGANQALPPDCWILAISAMHQLCKAHDLPLPSWVYLEIGGNNGAHLMDRCKN